MRVLPESFQVRSQCGFVFFGVLTGVGRSTWLARTVTPLCLHKNALTFFKFGIRGDVNSLVVFSMIFSRVVDVAIAPPSDILEF